MVFTVASAIEFQKLHFPVAQMLSAQDHNPFILTRSVCPRPFPAGSAGFFFQSLQKILLKSTLPLVKGFPCDSEVSCSEAYILAMLLPKNDPFQAATCRTGQMEKFCHLAPSGILITKLVSAGEVSGVKRCEEPASLLFSAEGCGHSMMS